jgi:hypothetical protein
MKCIWCGTPHSYYLTEENASRQNCRESDSGYHDFESVQCCCCTFGRRKGIDSKHQKLLRDRYKERPSTI